MNVKSALAVAILIVEIVAITLVIIGAPHAKLLLIGIEVSIGAVAVTTVIVLLRSWRRHRQSGYSSGRALARATNDVLHPRVALLLIGEARIFSSIGRWVARAPAIDDRARPIAYGSNLRPFLLALIPATIMEMIVVSLLLNRYPLIHWIILAVSAYGLLWLLGLAASIRVRPHTLTDDLLTLRCMTFFDLEVGLDAYEKANVVRIDGCKRSVEVVDGVLTMSIMGVADVAVTFREPVTVSGDRTFSVNEVRFAADAPGEAVALLRSQLGTT